MKSDWRWRNRAPWLALAWAVAAFPAQADENTRWVRGTQVNLRAAPERNAAVLARLRLNTPVQLQGPQSGEFCAVKPQRGHPAQGFVACALLAPRELSEAGRRRRRGTAASP